MAIDVQIRIDVVRLKRALSNLDIVFSKFGVTIHDATKAIAAASKQWREEQEDIYRAAWWTRGEGPPEFLARHEPEWWERGEEPPPFGCAA